MAAQAPSEDVQRVIATALDAAFYRAVYEDLAGAGDLFRHYALQGWREGRDPAPWFSARAYLEANPDVAEDGLEPLSHYLTRGRFEGREVYPSAHAHRYFARRLEREEPATWDARALLAPAPNAPAAPAAPVAVDDGRAYQRALAATEFDVDFYLSMNPDVAEAGVDALDHFLMTGWREGRDPNPRFSVRDYLETYGDIAAAGVNPFVHFLQAGRAEGRAPKQDLGFRYDVLAGLAPVAERVARAQAATAAAKRSGPAKLEAALANARTGLNDLHLTFSHDDYTAHLGGVQLCLRREAARIARLGRDHLHIHPAAAWPVVRAGEPGALGVVFNGQSLGAFSAATVARVLSKTAAGPAGRRSLAIHSLLGHSVEETVKIVRAAGLTGGFFWLHDFASLCAGFHLLRDDVQDCAAPPPNSAACNVCIYGDWRTRHLEAHGKLFDALDLTVVAPSKPTLDLWKASRRFRTRGEVVLPHAKLTAGRPAATHDGPLRVAFAGVTAAHKGWPVFRDLALRFAEDPRYEFIHFGARRIGGLPIAHEPALVTADNPKVMQQALEARAVDVTVVWPLCRETFSFTAYEAVAAGSAVLTNPDSGNVAAFVESGGHGRVLADEDALAALFESGEVLALGRAARRARRFALSFSGMTADLLARKAAA